MENKKMKESEKKILKQFAVKAQRECGCVVGRNMYR